MPAPVGQDSSCVIDAAAAGTRSLGDRFLDIARGGYQKQDSEIHAYCESVNLVFPGPGSSEQDFLTLLEHEI
jgi:hypothetical protein